MMLAEIEHAIEEALASHADALALACMDTRSGLLLGIQTRSGVDRDDVELAASSAAHLCVAPAGTDLYEEDEPSAESFVTSSRWVHAYARVPGNEDLVVVGVAPGDVNVALLRAWIRSVAARVERNAAVG